MSGEPTFRLIVDPPAPGAWNMAVDETLLGDAVVENIATLRFYEWDQPTLSLGYFQQYEDRQQHAASRRCALVRRQSGGGAILHDRELTYSLALPPTHPLAKNSQQLYTAVHAAIVQLLTRLLPPSDPAPALSIHCPAAASVCVPNAPHAHPAHEPFLCFERRAPGDVVLTPPPTATSAPGNPAPPNWKIVGSAQRRHRGAILQHGSLLLARSPAAPELPGYCDLTGTTITASTLVSALSTDLGQLLGATADPSALPASVRQSAQHIARDIYGSDSWTRRR
jgi:lipoyl(octanoyl) transferase